MYIREAKKSRSLHEGHMILNTHSRILEELFSKLVM